MKDKIFFDTNIIVYIFDKSTSEKGKHLKIKEIIAEVKNKDSLCTSVQAINEFVIITTKKIEVPLPIENGKAILETISQIFTVFPINIGTSMKAIDIKIRYKFSYWDSLIIASAIENNCSYLYSEDMQDGMHIDDKLVIVNPFSKKAIA